MLQAETGDVSVFIVGFAIDRIDYKPQKLKFLSGLGYAIYVAAFDLDAESDNESEGEGALDQKEFLPRPLTTTFASAMDLSSMGGRKASQDPMDKEVGMGVWGSQHMTELNLSAFAAAHSQPTKLPSNVSSTNSFDSFHKDHNLIQPPMIESPGNSSSGSATKVFRSNSQTSLAVEEAMRLNPSSNLVVSDLLKSPGNDQKHPETPLPMALMLPPTWDPVDEFSYPVAEIPISSLVPDNLLLEHFDDVQHIADGSNANIFLAKLNGERVIIKMIKADVQTDPVAVHEFDVEHGMLSRISHPNIIKLLGAGRSPRRFVVLEWLGGGSLNTILSQNQTKPGLAQKLFRRPTFTYANLLSKARDMAEALDFLHSRCHPGATVIHRGGRQNSTLRIFPYPLLALYTNIFPLFFLN
jgi:Protein tyrosine and serine/threonine kinase